MAFEKFASLPISKVHHDLIEPLADSTAVESYYNRGEVEEIGKVLQGAEENSSVEWSYVGGIRTSKSIKKMRVLPSKNNKENVVVKTRSNKKDDIPSTLLGKVSKKEEMKNCKARDCCPHATPSGKGFKAEDVRVSPSSAGRPSNMHRRMVETNKSIADGS